PVGFDPAALFHAIERGVERPLFDGEGPGGVFQPAGDGVAVPGTPRQGLEDQRVQAAVEAVADDGGGSRLLHETSVYLEVVVWCHSIPRQSRYRLRVRRSRTLRLSHRALVFLSVLS